MSVTEPADGGGIRFRPGSVVATPGALDALRAAGQTPADLLTRHLALEQGELSKGDHRLNQRVLKDGSRIFSAFVTAKGERLWVITEADRSSTCILLPEGAL